MQIQLEVLGRFRVIVADRVIAPEAWKRERGAALIKLLAITPGHRLHREQVMTLFWPDLEPEAAGANLRKAVHFARRALGEHEVIDSSDVLAFASGVEVRVDSEAFEEAAKQALRSPDRASCERAADLYRGELFPDDRYVEWLDEPRQQLRQRLLRVLRAGKLWERLIEIEPTDEQAQCELMQAALDAGRRGEAIRLFQALRERLRVDLGIGPSKAAVALHDRALAAEDVAPASVAERVRGWLAWGVVHLNSGEFAKAEKIARESRQIAFGAGLDREMGEATALLGIVSHMQGRWSALFRSEIVEWVRAAPAFTTSVFDGHLCLAEFCLASPGGSDQMLAIAHELCALAERADSKPGCGLAALILGDLALCGGRLDEAADYLGQAERFHHELGAVSGCVLACERMARLALARGEAARARELLDRAEVHARTSWLSSHLRIRLKALRVEAAPTLDAAIDAVHEGDRILSGGSQCQPCSMGFRTASALTLIEAGEIEQGSRRLDEADRLAALWSGGVWAAAIWEARGVLRRAQGNEPRALAAFEEGAARFGELGRPLDRARCARRVSEPGAGVRIWA